MNRIAIIYSLSLIVFAIFISNVNAEDKSKHVNWPKTVDDAVIRIIATMPDKDKNAIRTTKKEDLIKFHHGWGTGIRNKFGLWKGNKELIISACGKLCHPDDASMIIIEAVWKKLQKEP